MNTNDILERMIHPVTLCFQYVKNMWWKWMVTESVSPKRSHYTCFLMISKQFTVKATTLICLKQCQRYDSAIVFYSKSEWWHYVHVNVIWVEAFAQYHPISVLCAAPFRFLWLYITPIKGQEFSLSQMHKARRFAWETTTMYSCSSQSRLQEIRPVQDTE